MEGREGLLTTFGLGFTPHIQRQAGTNLRLCAHAVDLFLHLTIASVAPFHGMRGGGPQLGIEKCQSLFQRGGKELFQCLRQQGEWQAPTSQLGSLIQSRLGPTAPVKKCVDLAHEFAQEGQLREAPGDPPPLLPLAVAPMTLHA